MYRFATFVFVLALSFTGAACGGDDDDSTPTSPSLGIPYSTAEIVVGTGAEALNGRRVTVSYTGWLYSTTAADNKGLLFDSNASYPRPVLGGGGVIVGFDRGIIGMRVGGKRRVIIPPELGYGAVANGNIPANSTLIFEIEVLSVQ